MDNITLYSETDHDSFNAVMEKIKSVKSIFELLAYKNSTLGSFSHKFSVNNRTYKVYVRIRNNIAITGFFRVYPWYQMKSAEILPSNIEMLGGQMIYNNCFTENSFQELIYDMKEIRKYARSLVNDQGEIDTFVCDKDEL